MFTVKQIANGHEKMWPRINCVDAFHDVFGKVTHITALFADGGTLEFANGEREQCVYVMNDNGSTVSRYLLPGGEPALPALLPVAEAA
jgi:hypothetical protein